jgi:hypothetical protein
MMVSSRNHASLLRVVAYTDVDFEGENVVGNIAMGYEFIGRYRVENRTEIATEQDFKVYEYTIRQVD